MRGTLRMLPLVFGLVIALGCAKAPTQDIEAARQAMEGARSASAAEYAPEAWAGAEDAEARLQAELKIQEDSFALSRSYDNAKSLAAEVKAAAEKATAEAEAGRETARSEASSSMEQARTLLAEVQALVAKAPQGKGTVADVAALKADTGSTEGSLKEAQTAYDAGKYMEAKIKAQAAIEALEKIKAQIGAAQQARNAGHRA